MVLVTSLLHWHVNDPLKFSCYLLIGVLAATMKVRLPGVDGTMSVHFLFVLLGIMELSLPETLVIGCAAAAVQSLWKLKRQPELVKVVFNVFGMTANAVWLTYLAYTYAAPFLRSGRPVLLVVAAGAYFLSNTVPVSVVIVLAEGRSLRQIWKDTYFWSFPYYLVGAALVGGIDFANQHAGWQSSLLILPVMYLIYSYYRLYLLNQAENDYKLA